MAIVPLITDVEADANLPASVFPEWDALTVEVKDYHILNASTYTIKTWECTDEDFETPALSDDAKRAVSLYSEADRAGNLYGDPSTDNSSSTGSGALTQLTLKAGSLEKTEKFSEEIDITSTSPVADALALADDIFCSLGCSVIRQSGSVVGLARN